MATYGTNNNNNPYETDADPYDYDYQPFERIPINNAQVSGDMNPSRPSLPTPPTHNNNMSRVNSPPLSNNNNNGGGGGGTVVDESLRLKAMELARREAELERRERDLMDMGELGPRKPKNNWPICYPFLYHHISAEIPAGLRRTATYMGYLGWMMISLALVLNFAGSLLTCFSKAGDKAGIERVIEKVKFMLFAGLFVIIGIPCHFILSYWPLYQAMRTVNIGRFTLFFVGYAIPIVFCAFCISGWSDYGPCGVIVAILYFPTGSQGNVAAFVYNLVMGCIWAFLVAYFVTIFIMGILVFRRENHTLAKARAYAQNSIMSRVTTAAVNNAFSANGDEQ